MLQLVWWPEHEELHYDDMCIAVETVLQDSHLKYEQLLAAVSHKANTLLDTELTIFINSQL